MEDEHASRLRTLIASAKSTTTVVTATDYSASDISVLRSLIEEKDKVIATLQQKLQAQTTLITDAENVIEQLLNARHTSSPFMKLSLSNTKSNVFDVSDEYCQDTFSRWKNQVWFSHGVPPAVEAECQRLKEQLPYICKNRSSAPTATECYNLVKEHVLNKWQIAIPPLIIKELKGDIKVYNSKADARAEKKGEVCEASHLIVFLANKISNKASLIMRQQQSQNKALNSVNNYLESHVSKIKESLGARALPDDANDSNSIAEESTEIQLKWNSNPSLTALLTEARHSLNNSPDSTLMTFEQMLHALRMTISKLTGTNKPKFNVAMKYLASIIALKELAENRQYKIDADVFAHRRIFQYKMVEHWNDILFKKSWDEYRYRIFSGINSILMYLLLCGENKTLYDAVDDLGNLIRPAQKPEFYDALQSAKESNDIIKLYNFIQKVGTGIECASFFVKAFIAILQHLGVINDTVGLPETILLHLLNDLDANDYSKISSFEKNHYVQVISILTTIMLNTGYQISAEIDTKRTKYLQAALFIGQKMKFLIHVETLSKEEENIYWFNRPVTDFGGWLDYCPDKTTLFNILPMIKLPKLHETSESDHETIASEAHLYNDSPTSESDDDCKETSDDEIETPSAMNRLKVEELRKRLISLHLSARGNKSELLQRLLSVTVKRKQAEILDSTVTKRQRFH